jgi:hypothetical protein
MKQQFSGSQIFVIFAIFCAKFSGYRAKGIRTEGRKDHEGLIAVEREASIGEPCS